LPLSSALSFPSSLPSLFSIATSFNIAISLQHCLFL
jgi:hypothetical protein